MPSRYDDVIAEIAAYACRRDEVGSDEAFDTARLALMDSIGCAFLALGFPACRDFLASGESYGETSDSVPVPGTQHSKPASVAAFDLTSAIRWLDFNDTWLANEWGHPSDNFGAILAPAYRVANATTSRGDSSLTIRDVLELAIRAYEIQGVLALDNAFNRVGIDHVLLVKVASSAVAAALYSENDEEIVSSAVSHAWLDATLRTYRHAPNTMSRKSWAAADAAARGVNLASFAVRGMPGCYSALSAPNLRVPRRMVQQPSCDVTATVFFVCDGERAFQGEISCRISRPNGGGSWCGAAPRSGEQIGRDRFD